MSADTRTPHLAHTSDGAWYLWDVKKQRYATRYESEEDAKRALAKAPKPAKEKRAKAAPVAFDLFDDKRGQRSLFNPRKRRNPMTEKAFTALFLRERERFARKYPRVRGAGLALLEEPCTPGSPCGHRDVAMADLQENTVYFVRRALAFPVTRLRGLLRHELGHLADPTPDKRGAEKRADRIALQVTGHPIRYDRRDVQTTGRGRATRPAHLHQ